MDFKAGHMFQSAMKTVQASGVSHIVFDLREVSFILKTAVESGIPRRLRLKSWVIRSAEGVPAGTVTAFHGETPQKCD